MKQVIIYTDGACSGNPGPGGWGAVLKYGAHERELSGGEASTTNNRMELTAVIVCIRVTMWLLTFWQVPMSMPGIIRPMTSRSLKAIWPANCHVSRWKIRMKPFCVPRCSRCMPIR